MSVGYPILTLSPGREIHLQLRHHSVFRTAFGTMPDMENGGIAEIQTSEGLFVCYATVNKKAYIAARAISFERGDPLAALRRNILHAIDMRRILFSSDDSTAIRLINAEGDSIPGLVVDQYGDVLVLQITTLGMEKLKSFILDILIEKCAPKAIFEKSMGAARRREELEPTEKWLRGSVSGPIEIIERGLKYLITLEGSQKTGLFLDQREMRALVRKHAAGRTVLDCCSYVGGFSMNALMGGAQTADAVDYDDAAIERVHEHAALNGFGPERVSGYSEDVFDFLRRKPSPRPYDFIILDPPAFAKRSTDLDQAKGAYTDMNRMAMQMLPPGGMLLTCSCSFQIDSTLFQTIVFHAARQANRNIRILQRHHHAYDHPVNLYHPEIDYLKSLLLWVE